MKRLLAPSFFAILIACGGTVDGQNKKEPPLCSQATTCSDGDTCRMPFPACPGETPSEYSCSCSHGSFACPDIGRAPCTTQPKPPGWYEVCGIAGKVNDGEWSPPEAKGESCDSYRQTTCEEPLPKVQCTCDGTKFVCGLPPACPTPTADAGKAD